MSRWRRARVVGTIVVITGVNLAAGQTPAQRPAAPGPVVLPAGGFILGQVVDAGNGQGIPGVQVSLTGGSGPTAIVDERLVAQFEKGLVPAEMLARAGTRRAITDAEGRFLFRDLTRGSYTATATLGGYSPGAFGRRRPEGPSRPLELADNEKVADATIRLWKLAAISGTITDDAGEPVVGISVLALRRYYVGGHQRIGNAIGAQTDDRGIYRVASLTPGDYVIVVPFETTSYPATAVEEDRVAAAAGPSGERVRARAESGAPAPSAGIRIGDLIVQTSTGANKSLALPVASPADRLMVYPTWFFPGTTSLSQATPLTVGSGEQRTGVNLVTRPVPSTRVSGAVTAPDGPAANLAVRLYPADATSLSSESGFEIATASTDAAGRFTLLGVATGRYTLRAYRIPRSVAFSDGSSAGMVRGGVTPSATNPTQWAELPVAVGDTPVVDVAVTLRPGATVSGHLVFDGAAVKPTPQQMQQISITVSPADGRFLTTPAPAVRADTSGRFVTTGHPPGQYAITASPPTRDWVVKSIAAGGTNFLEQPLVVDAADLGNVVVTYTDRVAELSGTVQGIPANTDEIFTVLLFPSDPNWIATGMVVRRPISVPVDRTGTFQTRVPLAGEYLAVAISQDFAAEQTTALFTSLARMATRVPITEGEKKAISLPVSRVK